MRSSEVPRFITGLDPFSFDEHGTIAVRLLKYLAPRAPSRLTKGLLKAVGIGRRPHLKA